jgi:hypothetical protein
VTRTKLAIATAATVGVVGSVVLANWLTDRYGFVPIGFGLSTTAGTLAAGAALALRDALQDAAGKAAVLVAVVLGAVLSFAWSAPALAVASATAFAVAELADLLVYTPLRNRAEFGSRVWATAVLASGVVGAVVDTVLFLRIAYGWSALKPDVVAGQFMGKILVSLLFVVAVKGVRRAVPHPSHREPARA